MNPLAEIIRQRREGLMISQAELVLRTGLSHSVIYRAETGDTVPSRATLLKLAGGLQIKPEELFSIADDMRAREEELWIGFPHTIWAAPMISMLTNFSLPFKLVQSHFCDREQDGAMTPVNAVQEQLFQTERHRPLDGVGLMEVLTSRSLDGAWVPRTTYLAHKDSVTRYATVSTSAPPADLLVASRSRAWAAPRTLTDFWHAPRTLCCLYGEDAEAEYSMLCPRPEGGPPPVRAGSFPELLATLEHAIKDDQSVLCMVNEPLSTLVRERARALAADCFPLRRESKAYQLEFLMNWSGVQFDFVFLKDRQVPGAWIKSYLRLLQSHIQYINSRQRLDYLARHLRMEMPTVRAKLDETGARFELMLDLDVLLLFTA